MKLYKIITTEKNDTWDRLVEDLSKHKNCIKEKKKASAKEIFDFYIKQDFLNGKPYLPGLKLETNTQDNFGFYISRYKRNYDRYFSSNIKIEEKLSDDIKKCYDNGKGNEFTLGKYYSVASSSRFATACFSKYKDEIKPIDEITIDNQGYACKVVTFEKNLEISSKSNEVISYPQMDVFLEANDELFFIEVKCHEIFYDHSKIELNKKYRNVDIPLLDEKSKTEFISKDGKALSAKDFGCELKTSHFDFKQFLCHLMGIQSFDNKGKKIHFYYLFYKNESFEKGENSKIYKELEDEMNIIFKKYKEKYPKIDFGYFYNSSFDTIKGINCKNCGFDKTANHNS